MNISHHNIEAVITECLRFLKNDGSVIHNFIDIETLEEYWTSLHTEEFSVKDFKEKRQSIEEDILIFIKMVRGLFLSVYPEQTEPNWLKTGHKNRDEAISHFFQELKKQDTKFLNTLEFLTKKNIQEYRNLFVQWKIARKKELDAPASFERKHKQSRILKKLLENIVELSRDSQEDN